MTSSDDSQINRTVVAVDKDKHSQFAVKWAVDHLVTTNSSLILLYVKQKNVAGGGDGGASEEGQHIFVPYRGFCARKSIQVKEVVLEENDVAKALVDYISTNFISNIVMGTSSRNSLLKTFKKPDIPSVVTKNAPDFCSVYVIAKTKVLTIRSAQRPIANTAAPPKLPSVPSVSPEHTPRHSSGLRTEKLSMERSSVDSARRAARLRAPQIGFVRNMSDLSMDNFNLSATPSTRSSDVDDEILDPLGMFNSIDISNKNYDFSIVGDSRRDDNNSPFAANDLEAEMRRLKLELKQTMDMYSTACKEAITAKQKAKELNERKPVDQMRFSDGPAMAIVEMEKAKCKAAMEAAEAAQRLAESEVQKRRALEMKANQESEVLTHNDTRYRRYSIKDIEVATENFSDKLKIGEGGYGPVYRAKLDHTPVAIKVLRSDAAQGKKQFQQEVEILSSMRHPNMVLLLGACPEYGCLVYEHMNYGSLEDRLNRRGGTPSIPWRIRFRVAAEIGTALTFLHQAKPEPLVHRDLKPDNILLDRNFVSKIADVGLARLVPPSVADSVTQYHMTSAAGTFCYIDPEYQQTGMLTTKSDVYSFGVVLLQIITARPPMGLTHQAQRAIDHGKFDEFLDPSVPDWPVNEALSLAKLALRCCELRKKDRPDLASVVLPELIRLRELGEDGDNFFFNHRPHQSTRNTNTVGSHRRLPSWSNGSQHQGHHS